MGSMDNRWCAQAPWPQWMAFFLDDFIRLLLAPNRCRTTGRCFGQDGLTMLLTTISIVVVWMSTATATIILSTVIFNITMIYLTINIPTPNVIIITGRSVSINPYIDRKSPAI